MAYWPPSVGYHWTPSLRLMDWIGLQARVSGGLDCSLLPTSSLPRAPPATLASGVPHVFPGQPRPGKDPPAAARACRHSADICSPGYLERINTSICQRQQAMQRGRLNVTSGTDMCPIIQIRRYDRVFTPGPIWGRCLPTNRIIGILGGAGVVLVEIGEDDDSIVLAKDSMFEQYVTSY
ncbi:hypothetical protein J6590_048348 [Homalodisca vitripennis]|nr:hypothetical protein J6590_048348 [Homalodisca vitripennis]